MTDQSGHDLFGGDGTLVLRLRLLIARAANKDSLAWWEDESLTSHAGFLLERLFPMAPALAARSLALRAALARHKAACASHPAALHLYRLDADNQDELALRNEPLLSTPVPEEPIPSLEVLRQHLEELLDKRRPYSVVRRFEAGALQIKVPPAQDGTSPLLHRAQTLAWAYLEGAPHEPVFPFCLE